MKNFTFTNKTRFDSCGYDVYEYEHISGAKLIYIDSGTEEKSFCAAFKTIPEDSTGVFHILEHSVLDGSKNYPMNSPFLFMIKNINIRVDENSVKTTENNTKIFYFK